MTRRAGFTLLEALVALAIASVCLLALFGLQLQLSRAQRRYEAAMARADARRNILALVRDLNPELQPEGSVDLPDGERLSWTARALSPARRALTPSGQPGPFAVRLYAVDAALGREGAARDTVTVERLGWRRLAAQGSGGAATAPLPGPPPPPPPPSAP